MKTQEAMSLARMRMKSKQTRTRKKSSIALSQNEKRIIVTALACRESPLSVQSRFRDQFSQSIPLHIVASFDPTVDGGRPPAAKWKNLFFRSRRAVDRALEEVQSHETIVRLRGLTRLMKLNKAARNHRALAECECAFRLLADQFWAVIRETQYATMPAELKHKQPRTENRED